MRLFKQCQLVVREFSRVISSGIRLFVLAWKLRRGLMMVIGGVIVITSITPFLQNFAMGRFIDLLAKFPGQGKLNQQQVLLLTWGLGMGALYALSSAFQFFLKTSLYKELFHLLCTRIHGNVASLDIQSHEDSKRKDLITTVLEKAMWHAPDFMQRMSYLVQNLFEVSIASVVFFWADALAGAMISLVMVPRLIVEIIYNHDLWRTEQRNSEVRRWFWYARHFIVEMRSLIEVKLYQNVPFFVNRVSAHLETVKKRELEAERRNISLQLIALLVSEVVAVWVVVRFVGRTVDGRLDVGMLTFYLASMVNYRFALNSLCQNIGSQFRDGKFVCDMFEAFDLKPILPVAQTGELPVPDQIEEIVFDRVRFAYPGTQSEILKGISLRLSRGTTLGLVASNGAGKTTLVKLLCRLYDPTAGAILVNGIDIRRFRLEEWQHTIGVLLQEFNHYEHLDIETAIALGRDPDRIVNLERVEEAARAAGAHEFVVRFPHGYGTRIGRVFEHGIELSGGQYQKIAIARMFYRNAPISIFDEPTSAIDSGAEAQVFERIFEGMPNTMKILISHRYSTLRKADQICVLEDGRVKESGNHQELMALGGLYACRYREQAEAYN